jgi:phosphoenolpyruvate-protein kinase (PTS system EI component)
MESLKKQLEEYRLKQQKVMTAGADYSRLSFGGEEVHLKSVVSSREEALDGAAMGAEGIGLFRMEVLYLTRDTLPTEAWLMDQLKGILEPFREKDIIIRLLDLGGDKTLSYMDISERYNSFLGVRGIRLLMKNPQLLETQMRVCLKLSREFNIRIMIPMVTLVEDVLHVKALYRNLKIAMDIPGEIPIGTMIETPASVISAGAILEESDFVSIGSNDLIQYTMAADREKLNVSKYFEQGNVIIQESIRSICLLAKEMGKPCGLCGDLAQNTLYTEDLLKAGCREFSVNPAFLPLVREKIRESGN